ncbi:unnamed protein product [Dicrocoelium dendriticum]|nr:unnamed protein product [Dicrocoelium dendriticum]
MDLRNLVFRVQLLYKQQNSSQIFHGGITSMVAGVAAFCNNVITESYKCVITSGKEWRTTLRPNTTHVKLHLDRFPSHTLLAVVIENSGYVNYGYRMQNNVKGLFGDVNFNGVLWSQVVMGSIKQPLNISKGCKRSKAASSQWPIQGAIFTGNFTIKAIEDVHDTFVQLDSFNRGLVAINDNLVGRFDQLLGPQQRLYIPRDFLQAGINRVVVGEFRNITEKSPKVTFHTDQKWLS